MQQVPKGRGWPSRRAERGHRDSTRLCRASARRPSRAVPAFGPAPFRGPAPSLSFTRGPLNQRAADFEGRQFRLTSSILLAPSFIPFESASLATSPAGPAALRALNIRPLRRPSNSEAPNSLDDSLPAFRRAWEGFLEAVANSLGRQGSGGVGLQEPSLPTQG